jgi:hypothetical protein
VLHQEAVRVVRRARHIAQVALRHQGPRGHVRRLNNLLSSIALGIVWVGRGVDYYTVHRDMLADVSLNQVIVVAAFLEVVVLPFRTLVGQEERLRNVVLNGLQVGVEREKELVEALHVVLHLHRAVILHVVGGGRHQLALVE